MREIDSSTALISKNKQLNHYFIGGDFTKLAIAVEPHVTSGACIKLDDIVSTGKNISVRTRDKDGTVLLVIKASVGDDSSANGVARMEFEEVVDLSLDALDQLLLAAGFAYQAKWSREREEYVCQGLNICLDRNAGYGWLAEFEKIVDSDAELANARMEIDGLMSTCGVSELPQERLERMFAFYNKHWLDYYGTDKIFTIE